MVSPKPLRTSLIQTPALTASLLTSYKQRPCWMPDTFTRDWSPKPANESFHQRRLKNSNSWSKRGTQEYTAARQPTSHCIKLPLFTIHVLSWHVKSLASWSLLKTLNREGSTSDRIHDVSPTPQSHILRYNYEAPRLPVWLLLLSLNHLWGAWVAQPFESVSEFQLRLWPQSCDQALRRAPRSVGSRLLCLSLPLLAWVPK